MTYEEQMILDSSLVEEMVTTKGWQNLKKSIEDKIDDFNNISVNDGFKSMEDFNFARGQVCALKGLLIEIDSKLTNLNNYREKSRPTTSE